MTTVDACNSATATLKLGDAEAVVSIPAYNFIIVPKGGSSGSSDNPVEEYDFINYNVIENDTQVPEFSMLTMGFAVISVGLGLAFLRKH
jgi:hypothetical protein